MAGSKKKKSFTLILLLIAMVVLIGAYIWLVKYNDKKEAGTADDTDTKTETVADIAADSIKTIYFKNENAEMTLAKGEEDTWKNSADELFPVNQTYAQNMASAFKSLTSTRTIPEGSGELSDYGLENPVVTVTITDKDGKETSIFLGSEAPVGGGYYASLKGDSKIYIIAASFYNNFNYNLTQMAAVETIPSITAANITHLIVKNKDKPDFEVLYDKNNTSDFAGLSNWTLREPYKTPLSADADAVSTLMGNYSALSFSSCVDYNAKDLSKYGLKAPAASVFLQYYEEYTKDSDTKDAGNTADNNTADQKEEEKTRIDYTLELLIGSQDEAGNYYVKTKDSNAVNTMSRDTVDKIINIDAYSILNHYVSLVNIDKIHQVDIAFGGKTFTLSMEKITSTAEGEQSGDNKDTEVTNYYFNGTKADEDAFKKLYQTIISPTTEREIPSEYFEGDTDQSPVMTVTYYLNEGGTIDIIYKPYDDSYYVVNSNGIEYFLTDLRKVLDIEKALTDFSNQ